MPLALGWEELNEYFFGMNLSVDFIFLLDVCKNFCTGYVDSNEAIVMNKDLVRRNYLRGFFVTDFCSSIPLDLILKSVSDEVMNTSNIYIQSLSHHHVNLLARIRLGLTLLVAQSLAQSSP